MKWSEMSTEERDRLVYTKVMGNPEICKGKTTIRKCDTPSRKIGEIAFSYWVATCDSCKWEKTCGSPDDAPKEHAPWVDIPSYSTDMNAAWQIVEAGKFHSVELECYLPDITEPALYRCFILVVAEGQPYKQYASKTAQEAICLASLKARGVRVEP